MTAGEIDSLLNDLAAGSDRLGIAARKIVGGG
jgi:hypothetical protein